LKSGILNILEPSGPIHACNGVAKKKRRYYERILRAYKHRTLRKLFGPKWEEVIGDWSKLHNEEFHNFQSTKYCVINSRKLR
jgi:hypothetical protein